MRREAIKRATANDLMERDSVIGAPAKEVYVQKIRPEKVIKQWYKPRDQMKSKWENGIQLNTEDKEDRKLDWANRVRRLETLMKEGSMKEFYREVNRMTKIKVRFPPVKGIIEEGGKTIMEEEEVNKLIARYYEKLFQ